MSNTMQAVDLNDNEIDTIAGGPVPVVALVVAWAVGTIGASVAAFNGGYVVGRDIANNEDAQN